MAKISNYQINTHFTALRQLPEVYKAHLDIPAKTISGTMSELLGETYIDVPGGAYVETVVISTSLDGQNHLGHWFYVPIGEWGNINFSVTQANDNRYHFVVRYLGLDTETVDVPRLTANLMLRLATAPF